MIFSNCEISRAAAASPLCLPGDGLAKGYGDLGKAHPTAIPRPWIALPLTTLDLAVLGGEIVLTRDKYVDIRHLDRNFLDRFLYIKQNPFEVLSPLVLGYPGVRLEPRNIGHPHTKTLDSGG